MHTKAHFIFDLHAWLRFIASKYYLQTDLCTWHRILSIKQNLEGKLRWIPGYL